MLNLSHVIASVLKDLTRAQDSCNRYSKALAGVYEDDPILRVMPVPNAVLDEAEIEIKFAVAGAQEVAFARNPEPPLSVYREAARGLAAASLRRALGGLKPAGADDPDRLARVSESLRSEKTLARLSERLARDLHAARRRLRSAAGGLDRPAAELVVAGSLASNLYGDPDLAATRDSNVPVPLREIIDESGGAMEILDAAMRDDDPGRTATELEVIVEADRLASLPAGSLQSLKLKVELRGYKWVLTEVDGVPDDMLVPEG